MHATVGFDVAAIASVAGLRDSCGNVPLDVCVPVRTSREPASASPDELSFLVRVDGVASLSRIAEDSGIPLTETIGIFLGLLREGFVSLEPDLL